MKHFILTIFALAALSMLSQSQVPQKFSYQAAIRNLDGSVMSSEELNIQVKLRKVSTTGDVVYEEVHSTSTNAQGVVSIAVGTGTTTPKGTFAEIPWTDKIFIEIGVKKISESTFQTLGVSEILSVPYAIEAGSLSAGATVPYAIEAGSLSAGAKEVKPGIGHNPEEPIFVVRNSDNQIVFAVYEDGVTINIDSPDKSKSARGGFAVGGLSYENKLSAPKYLTIVPDMVEFNILQPDPTAPIKSARGGFAVGGLSYENKSMSTFFKVGSDSTFIMNTLTATGNVLVSGDMLTGGTVGTLPAIDGSGISYKTTRIGNQVWMAENLRSLIYDDGTPILSEAFGGTPPIFVYEDMGTPLDPLEWGYLYALQGIDYVNKNICPIGWRLPTYDDWNILINEIGGGEMAIKLVDNTPGLWSGVKGGGEKSTFGFGAKPGGTFDADTLSTEPLLVQLPPIYNGLSNTAYFWSQPENISGTDASSVFQIQQMNFDMFSITSFYSFFDAVPVSLKGYSVRCIKNQ